MATATATATLTRPSALGSARRTGTILIKEAKYEFLKNLRLPMYSFATIGFPVMFYILFGIVMGHQEMPGMSLATYLIASYGTFGVMGASLYGTGSGLASERGMGWLQVKRASPMPPSAYFAGKIVMSMIFSAVVVFILLALGMTLGGVRMGAVSLIELVAVLVGGSLPFCALGLAIAYFVGPNSVSATINLIYLPMAFCSGLWIPFMFLPKPIQQFAHLLPSYHLSQLALGVIGRDRGEAMNAHWFALIAFTLICLGLALIGYRRDESKLYG
jgi:ABC-2 type transport system permease protein